MQDLQCVHVGSAFENDHIAHADGVVTRYHCERSGGGVWVACPEEFSETVDRLAGSTELRRTMGLQGRDYVLREYSWRSVIQRLEKAVQELVTT